ncbi:MAG: TonB-dependent receptor [Thiohalomonadaceae bacterium]
MMTATRFTRIACLVSSLFTIAAGAQAQTTAKNATAPDHPVISVTATRMASELQDTTAAVSVVGKEELDTIKFTSATTELMKRIPGYSMIRNLRIPSGRNYTINLVDGLATRAAFGTGTISGAEDTNTFDIERVEVVRGPASALYGSNALGGVINVITREPPLDPEYRVWGELGEHQRRRGGVSAAGTLGALGYFADANFLDTDGWQDRTARRRRAASGKLQFAPDLQSSVTVRAEYLDNFQEDPGSLSEAQFKSDWRQAAVLDAYNDEESVSGTVKYERQLGSRSALDISYGVRHSQTEGTPSYSAIGGISSNDVVNHNLVALYRQDFEASRSQLITGLDLLHSALDTTTFEGRTTSSAVAQQFDVTAVGTSPFVQYEIAPLERLRLSLGARYDRIEYSAEGHKTSRGSTTRFDESKTFGHVSPKAGASFDLNPHNTAWIGYGQGFVVPSRTHLFVGGRGYDANPDLDPERAENVEVGLRGRIPASRFTYDVAVYRTTITDMLVENERLEKYVNAGEVRVQGVETLLGWQPHDHWRLDVAHTYADNRYLDYVDGSDDLSGNTLQASPKHHLDTRLTWLPMPGLAAELEWNTITEYYTSDSNDDPAGKADRPDLFHLRVTWSGAHWSWWAHVLNLTDEKYAERVSFKPGGREFDVGVPRTFYAGLSYQW